MKDNRYGTLNAHYASISVRQYPLSYQHPIAEGKKKILTPMPAKITQKYRFKPYIAISISYRSETRIVSNMTKTRDAPTKSTQLLSL